MRVHLTLKSANKKTGKIPVSTTSDETCPPSCPFNGLGCYADQGPLRLHWRKVSENKRGDDFSVLLSSLRKLTPGQLWRHNQAGDLPGCGEKINSRLLERLTNASRNLRGFTYTHKPVEGTSITVQRNREAIRRNNLPFFAINLSANGVEHADKLMELNIAPVTTVLPSDETRKSFKTSQGNKVVVCPATRSDNITCESCQLCANHTRKSIIGFPAHGTQYKKVNKTLSVVQ
jgi:hypothetical protein